MVYLNLAFFLFKHKTAYEMRISDWSSDVCSSDLGPETHPFGAVLVGVAERAALPAAEGVIGNGHRDRHVDPHHADVHPLREFARGMAVSREDRDAIAILMLARQPHRRLEIWRAHALEHGPENLQIGKESCRDRVCQYV